MTGINERRAQASLEYLTTYGWAILIIVIVLAALAWLGVFNAQEKVPDRCTFEPPEMQCDSIRLISADTGGEVAPQSPTFTNRFSERIRICGIECRTGDIPQTVPTAADCLVGAGVENIAPGGSVDTCGDLGLCPVACYRGNALDMGGIAKPGDKTSMNFFVYYLKESDSNAGNARIARGTLVTTVE